MADAGGVVKAYQVEATRRPDSGLTGETDGTTSPGGRLLRSWGKSWPAGGACPESDVAASASTGQRVSESQRVSQRQSESRSESQSES